MGMGAIALDMTHRHGSGVPTGSSEGLAFAVS